MGNYTPEAAPVSASSSLFAQWEQGSAPEKTGRKPVTGGKATTPRPAVRPGRGGRTFAGAADPRKFAGIAGKSSWREDADRAVEAILDRLDTLAADLVMRPAMARFGLSFDEWIELLQLISHALFPEVFAVPGEGPDHEGLIPPKGGRDAFPLTPRRLRVLVALMAEWDAGGAGMGPGE